MPAEAGNADLLVSIGAYLGIEASPGEQLFAVRRGGKILSLPYEANQVWLYAIAPKSVSELRAIGTTQKLSAVNAATAWLFERRLLVHWPRNADERRGFLGDYRLLALGAGLGSIDGDPNNYSLAGGMAGRAIEVSKTTYEVWAASDGVTLGEACARAAQRLGAKPVAVEAACLQDLPALLAQGMAFLDTKMGAQP